MKRILFIAMMLLCATFSYAQRGKVTQAASLLSAGKLDEAKKFIDEGITHEKCINDPKSYFTKGQIYQSIFESDNNALKQQVPNALDIAYEAYKKVIELDDKKRYEKQLFPQYQNLINDFINRGVDCYNKEDFKTALVNFKTVLEIEKSAIVNRPTVDTALIYNAAIAAQKAEEYQDAEMFYKEAIKYNYEAATCYSMLANILKLQGRTEESLKYLHEGYELFPNDSFMLIELINYYLMGNEPESAEKYLDAAIAQNPTNAPFYRAKGTLYEKTGQTQKAVEMYEKTLSLDSADFVSFYNLGAIKLNEAINLHGKVIEIEDVSKYEKAMISVYEAYDAVIPYFVKALELQPKEKSAMQTLSELYFKLRTYKPEYQKKFEQMKAAMVE